MSENKIRELEEAKKQEFLNMNQTEREYNTKYIIEFEDWGQDFLRWYIDKDGYVIRSEPFQTEYWAGKFTIPETVRIGDFLPIWLNGETYVKYPIKNIEIN